LLGQTQSGVRRDERGDMVVVEGVGEEREGGVQA